MCKLYDQTCQLLCKSLVVNLVYYGQNIKDYAFNKENIKLSSCYFGSIPILVW